MKKNQRSKEEFDYSSFEDEAIARLRKGDELIGKEGIFTELIQRLVNRALEGELDAHLLETKAGGHQNRRNGHTRKEVKSSMGPLDISPPRDRQGSFEPEIVGKWSRKLGTGVEAQILGLYASGNSVSDIQKQLSLLYGLEYSSSTISAVTEQVWQEVVAWQQRRLESCYVVIFLDGAYFKLRRERKVSSHVIYTVYGVNIEGERDVLGLYSDETEGASYWGLVLEDLQRRGVEEVLFFCVDGLKGFSDSIGDVYPKSLVQRCIVHQIRSSTRFVASKDRKSLCADLRKIYTAADRIGAEMALEAFKERWGQKYPRIGRSWQENWEELMPFMDYGAHIRRMIYTTNPVEALHRIIRKVTKTKGAWVNEKSLLKQIYLALHFNTKSWKRKSASWKDIQRELIEKFGKRYTQWI